MHTNALLHLFFKNLTYTDRNEKKWAAKFRKIIKVKVNEMVMMVLLVASSMHTSGSSVQGRTAALWRPLSPTMSQGGFAGSLWK